MQLAAPLAVRRTILNRNIAPGDFPSGLAKRIKKSGVLVALFKYFKSLKSLSRLYHLWDYRPPEPTGSVFTKE